MSRFLLDCMRHFIYAFHVRSTKVLLSIWRSIADDCVTRSATKQHSKLHSDTQHNIKLA